MDTTINNSDTLKLAACTLVPDGNSVSNGVITWSIKSGDFTSNYFISVQSSGSDIILNFPVVSKIHSFIVHPNKWLAQMGIFIGVSPDTINMNKCTIKMFQKLGTQGGYGRSNGTIYNLSGDLPNFNFGTNVAAGIIFDPAPPYGIDKAGASGISGTTAQKGSYWRQASCGYVGSTANRATKRLFSGLGAFSFGYNIVDATTFANIGSSSVADVIEITSNTPSQIQLNANLNDSQGWPGANILTISAGINVVAILEP